MHFSKKFHTCSIRMQLTFCFSILIALLVACFVLVIALTMSDRILSQHQMENQQIALHIAKELDSQIENLEAAKRQFLYSTDTMHQYTEYLRTPSVFSKASAQNDVSVGLYRVLNTGVPQIYCMAVHGKDGSAICAFTSTKYSLYYNTYEQRLEALDDPDFSAGTTILPPIETLGGPMICMLVRFVSPQDHQTHAILEIQQRYNVFADTILEATANTQKQVLIYNSDNKVIYPLSADAKDVSLYLERENETIAFGMSGETEIAAFEMTTLSDWTVVVSEPKSVYERQSYDVCRAVYLIGFLALLACFALVAEISRRLTKPLAALQKEAQSIALESLGKVPVEAELPRHSYNEYEALQRTFDEMRLKLQDSVNAYLAMEKQNSEAKLLALQSKMHPHFINNVLASIEIMAERGEMQKVTEICRHLSEMLTYSMQAYDGPVPLQEEIRYAMDYVELMKIRYPKRLSCRFEIEEQVKSIQIPKMVIQPLIENSIKHGMSTEKLHILVRAFGTEQDYHICVTDDGRGFQPEQLNQKQFEACSNGPKRVENGIGLNNIRQRFQLYYGDCAIMQMDNKDGKTTVEIGRRDVHIYGTDSENDAH